MFCNRNGSKFGNRNDVHFAGKAAKTFEGERGLPGVCAIGTCLLGGWVGGGVVPLKKRCIGRSGGGGG